MNFLKIVFPLVGLLIVPALAAPGDRVETQHLANKIALVLGFKGTIQLKQEGDALSEPKLIKDAATSLPGIGVDFRKESQFRLLQLENRFPRGLLCRAAVRLKGRKEFVETSLVLPVMSGVISMESWQDPIEELLLFDFKLTDEKSYR